jgi:hypothetical protein
MSGFDPDEYLSKNAPGMAPGAAGSGFDPDKYLKDNAHHTGGGMGGALQAGLEKAANVLTAGYLPQLQSVAEEPIDQTLNLITGRTGKDDQIHADAYIPSRDANIKRLAAQSSEHPLASKIGTGAGIAASMLVPAGAASKAVKLGEKMLAGAKAAGITGAIYGGLANPGDTEGEISPLQLGDRAENAAKTGALGTVVGGLAPAVVEGATQVLSPLLRRFAERSALRAAGVTKAELKAMNKTGETASVGGTLLDDKIVRPFSTTKGIAKHNEAGLDALDDKLSALIDDAQSHIGKTEFWNDLPVDKQESLLKSMFDPKATAERLKAELAAKYNQVPKEKLEPAFKEIDAWLGHRDAIMLPSENQAAKQQMNKFLKDSDYYREAGIQKEGTLSVRRGLKEGVENSVDAIGDVLGDNAGQIRETNRQLGARIKIKKITDNKLASEGANRAVSLTDTVMGAAGAATGTTPLGAAMKGAGYALGNKAGRTFGSSLLATGANLGSKVINKSAILVGKLTPSQLARISPILQSPKFTAEEAADPEVLRMLGNNPELIDAIQDPKIRESLRKQLQRSPGSK